MRAIALFADLGYFPPLVALVNSVLAAGVRARVKVYDYRGLPHLARTLLADHGVGVVRVPAEVKGADDPTGFAFKPRVLGALGIADQELLLDVDTIVLGDLEEAFGAMEAGEVAAVREWRLPAAPGHAAAGRGGGGDDPESRHVARHVTPDGPPELPAGSFLARALAHPEAAVEGLPIYNGGLLGFSRARHGEVLDLWVRAALDPRTASSPFWGLEQHCLSLVLASLARDGRVAVHELPRAGWMRTWLGHREPVKLLGFEGGRPVLYDGAGGPRMQLYHYTGEILAPPGPDGGVPPVPVRFQHAVSDLGLPEGATQAGMERAWHAVWRGRHGSPAGELPRFFHDLGPLASPRCLDRERRTALGRLLGAIEERQPPGPEAPETWALALACDYLSLGGCRGTALGWLERPLHAVLGAEVLASGSRTLAWEADTDVALSFTPRRPRVREWVSDLGLDDGPCSEHHRGVYVNVG